MMPFRYFLDSAYVVPALRKQALGLPMNRRKTMIVVVVLAVHAGLIGALVHWGAQSPPPIEFVETQVVLERMMPNSVPISPPSPPIQQRVVSQAVAQPKTVLRVNEDALIHQAVKPAAAIPNPSPTPITPVQLPITQPVVVANKPETIPAAKGKCSQAMPLRISSNLVERNMTVRLVIRRTADHVASARMQTSTGNSSLDALIEQRARGLSFFNKGAECDGLSFTVAVSLTE